MEVLILKEGRESYSVSMIHVPPAGGTRGLRCCLPAQRADLRQPRAQPWEPERNEITLAPTGQNPPSPKSVYQICKDSGISQIVVSRFLSGERDIRLATAYRLAKAPGVAVAAR